VRPALQPPLVDDELRHPLPARVLRLRVERQAVEPLVVAADLEAAARVCSRFSSSTYQISATLSSTSETGGFGGTIFHRFLRMIDTGGMGRP
jgi:hypothetical protein